MGFFSFTTADTHESIPNIYSGSHDGRPVYLLQPNGEPPIVESSYFGNGVFGDVDCYLWLARINFDEREQQGLTEDELRYKAIRFESDTPLKYPLKFSFNKDAVYEDLPASENCPCQGFNYGYF